MSSFPHAESAEVFAFLNFMEDRELVDSVELIDQSTKLRSKWQNKKRKIKEMYKKKFYVCMKKEKQKYKKKLSRLQRTYEKSIRLKYLMGSLDKTFTMDEWRRDHD